MSFAFDPSHAPHRGNLTPQAAAIMDRAFYARRRAGLNVQFIGETGLRDEWSFSDRARLAEFCAGLAASGRDFAVSI